MNTKSNVLFIVTLLIGSTPGFSSEPQHCIKTPTIECRAGFGVKQVQGCFVCSPQQESEEPVCIKAPTIECLPGYVTGEDSHGCFRCVKNLGE